MCWNRKVLVGAGVIALGVLVFAPRMFGAVSPLLALAICPLGMVLMMRAMAGSGNRCRTDAPTEPTTTRDPETEIVRLQAEIDRLRAEQATARPAARPAPPPPTGRP